MTPPAWWRPTSHVLPGELTLTGLSQKKLGEVVVMHCPVCVGFSRHGWRSFDLCVAFRGDTLYWVGARIKCFEAVGGSSACLLCSPFLWDVSFLFMYKVYSNLQIPNYSEISLERNNPDTKVQREGSGRVE